MDILKSRLIIVFNRNKLIISVFVGRILNLVIVGLEVFKFWKIVNDVAVDM